MAEVDPASVNLDAAYAAALLPGRDPNAHKFAFGRLVVVAGSLDYAGAAVLTAMAAVRGGAGLVALAVPNSLRAVFAARVPEAVLIAMPDDGKGGVDPSPGVTAIFEREPDGLVIGPGLKETALTGSLVGELLSRAAMPAVVDAGALAMLARTDGWSETAAGPLVLTPHAGEFARLTGSAVGPSDDERRQRCAGAALNFGQVVVLKGPRTVVAAPDGRVAVAPFANAILATAGSGDVLAGLIGALLAQSVAPFDAACLGVYLHGRAGERLSWRFGSAGLAASDLPLEIALARHELDAHPG